MKLPQDSIITDKKLTHYLLIPKKRNDKSKWLNKNGYSLNNWKRLQTDIRNQVLPKNAVYLETNEYGNLYKIDTTIETPSDRRMSVSSVWMTEKYSGITKFITMYPMKKE